MKKTFKKAISVLLIAMMVLCSAPLSGFVGLELPEIGGLGKLADSVSEFLAEVISMAKVSAWTIDDDPNDITFTVKFFRESPKYSGNWIETDKAAPGEEVKLRVYIDTGFYTTGGESCIVFDKYYFSLVGFESNKARELTVNESYSGPADDFYDAGEYNLKSNAIWMNSESFENWNRKFNMDYILEEIENNLNYFYRYDIVSNSIDYGFGIPNCKLDGSQWLYEFDFVVNENAVTNAVNGYGNAKVPPYYNSLERSEYGDFFIDIIKGPYGAEKNDIDNMRMFCWSPEFCTNPATLSTTSSIVYDMGLVDENGAWYEDTYTIVDGIIGKEADFGAITNPVHPDSSLVFSHWSTQKPGNGVTQDKVSKISYDYDSVTLYAVYEPVVKYIFDAGEGRFADGSFTKEYYYNYGDLTTYPEVPTAPGKLFVGWNDDIPETATENRTFEALYEDILCYVTYKADTDNDGEYETIVAEEEYIYGGKLCPEDTPKNYPTDVWKLADGTPVVFSDDYTVTGDITFYTVGSDEYPARFYWSLEDMENGADPYTTVYVKYGDIIPVPTVPEKPGYIFVQWELDAECQVMDSTNGKDFCAIFEANEITVKYDPDGGVCDVESEIVKYEESVILPEATREGYEFLGWFDGKEKVGDAGDDYAVPTENITLKAEWDAFPEPDAVEYEVYVSYPNPANPEEIIEKLVITDSALPGTTVDIIKSDEATNVDYYTYDEILAKVDVDGIEPDYDNRPAPMTVTENGGKIVVPFKLTEYTVEFCPNGGKFGTSEESVFVTGTYGQMIAVPEDPTRTGYYFSGWDKEVQDVFTKNLVYKATWEIQRNDVKFIVVDEHGDEVVRIVCSYSYGEIITAPDYDAPEGYVFNGWDIPAGTTMGESDMTFTSVLEPLGCKFVFNAGDGLFSDGETTKTYTYRHGETVTAPEIPEATGKRFVDWDNDIPVFAENDMTFEAIYEDELYTVTFKADNNADGIYETLAATRTFLYGEKVTIFDVPENYPTDGWMLEDGSSVTFSYYGDYTVTDNVTFYITQKTEYYGSNVKTYAELDAEYDNFVYVGIDVVEIANGQLTDGYVQPGDWLEYRMTVLSDMYVGTSYPCIAYEKDFFDVRVITSMDKPDHDNYENADYEGNLKFSDGTLMNPEHPYAAPNVATYHTLTALPATKITNQMGFCEIDEATYSNWDIVKSNVGITTTQWNNNFPMTEDTWWTCWYVRVKDGLEEGTQGQSFSPAAIWKNNINPNTGKGDTRRLADVFTADSKGTSTLSQSLAVRYNVVEHILLDDTYHTFTVGTNPADIPPESSDAPDIPTVKTYAELDAEYDKFVYVGIDVVEVANGELTDGYVQPGDWLEYRMTVLSDMYVSTSFPHIVYEKDFFDCRVVTSMNKPDHDNYENADYEGNIKFTDGTLMNPEHPYAAPNVPTHHTLTAIPATRVATQMGFCEIDAVTYNNWDLVKSNIGITTTQWNNNFPMTEDTWWTCWYVRVKDDLAEGTQGQSFSPAAIWKNNINPNTGKGDPRRFADVFTGDEQGTASKSVSIYQRYNIVTLLLDDTYHTFTIGTNPYVPESVVKKLVRFTDVNGAEISSTYYAKGEKVYVPEVDGLIAWLDSKGNPVELGKTFTMGSLAYDYIAVTDRDKFDVVINLNEGTYAEDAVLPEGSVVENGKLIIKAGFGETVDLTVIPLPEKEGYTGRWITAIVKVENIRGANASVVWTRNTYKMKFYLDKEAYDSNAEAVREITVSYGNAVPFANINVDTLKPEKKFAGWIDAETGANVNAEEIFAENRAFYADWTDYNSFATIWGRDYVNGGWKVIETKYADAGAVIKLNDLKALVTEENFGSSAVQYVVACPESVYDNETAIRTDYTMSEGENNIYLYTGVEFNVTFLTPVFDENGYISDSFNAEEISVSSSPTDEEKYQTANIITPASSTSYPGYTFVGWQDDSGEMYAEGLITLDFVNGTDYTFTAVYEKTVYTIEFDVNYKSGIKEIITAKETFTVGDTVTISELDFIDANGQDTVLPEIGKENREQTGGPYMGLDGFEFAGWKLGVNNANMSDCDVYEEITLTPELIPHLTFNDKIVVKGCWETLYYDFVAYYAAEIGADGKPVYIAMPAVQVSTGAELSDVYAAAAETAKANLPVGHRFNRWVIEEDSSYISRMPAYGLEVYAEYAPVPIDIYIDYNHGTSENPVSAEDSIVKVNRNLIGYVYYGFDVENDVSEGSVYSPANSIRNMKISDLFTPGADYELIGWNVYHVNDGEDVYDRAKWIEGYNDIPGSTLARKTLVFQAQWRLNIFELKWIVDGNETVEVYCLGDEIVIPEVPEKKGHTFVGWSMDIPEMMPAENLEITAVYEPNSYNIDWCIDGLVMTDTCRYGEAIKTPNPFKKKGYTFVGWSPEIPEKMPDYDLSFEAVWEINTHSVFWNIDGVITEVEYDYNSPILPPEIPEKEGYTFVGWGADVPSAMPDNDLSFTAEWELNTYEVKWIIDGEVTVEEYFYNETIAVPQVPAKTGHTFVGWTHEVPEIMPATDLVFEAEYIINTYVITWIVDGTETKVEYDYNSPIVPLETPEKEGHTFIGWDAEIPSAMPDYDLEFVAVWSINSYQIVWNTDGEVSVSNILYNNPIVLPDIPEKKGYTFKGFFPAVPDYMPAEDLEFRAIYEANSYDAMFITNGGTFPDGDSIKRISVAYDEIIPVPESPSREGYLFAGWSYNGKNIGSDAGLMDSVDGKVFEALWIMDSSATYAVEYHMMNTVGGYDVTQMYFSAGVNQAVSVRSVAGTGFVLNEEKSVLSGTVSADNSLILKVYIDRLSYNFNIVVDGITETVSYYYGAMISEPAIPVKDGFEFVGWDAEIPATMPANDITVTAVFKEKAEEKTYAKLTVTKPEKSTLYYGETITLYASVKNAPEGARVKWYVDGDGVSIKPSASGKSCKVTSTSNGNVVVRATLVDAKGNTIKGSDGKPVADYEPLYSEVTLWQLIVSFFRQLFGKSDADSRAFKGIF